MPIIKIHAIAKCRMLFGICGIHTTQDNHREYIYGYSDFITQKYALGD